MDWKELATIIGHAMAHAETRDPAMPEQWVKGWRHGTVDMFEYICAQIRATKPAWSTPAIGDGSFEDAVYEAYKTAIAEWEAQYGRTAPGR